MTLSKAIELNPNAQIKFVDSCSSCPSCHRVVDRHVGPLILKKHWECRHDNDGSTFRKEAGRIIEQDIRRRPPTWCPLRQQASGNGDFIYALAPVKMSTLNRQQRYDALNGELYIDGRLITSDEFQNDL